MTGTRDPPAIIMQVLPRDGATVRYLLECNMTMTVTRGLTLRVRKGRNERTRM